MSNRKAARARFLLVPWGCDARLLSSLLLRVDEHECGTGTAEMFLFVVPGASRIREDEKEGLS